MLWISEKIVGVSPEINRTYLGINHWPHSKICPSLYYSPPFNAINNTTRQTLLPLLCSYSPWNTHRTNFKMLIKYVFPLLISLSARFSFAISLRGTVSRVIDATRQQHHLQNQLTLSKNKQSPNPHRQRDRARHRVRLQSTSSPNYTQASRTLTVDSNIQVSRIKERVEEKEGIPPVQQRLIFGGKQMYVSSCHPSWRSEGDSVWRSSRLMI